MLKTVSSVANALGALNYKGTWNASTNTPTLASGVGTQGDYYVVSVDGTTNLDGITNWGVGDWAAFNGSVWQRVEGGADGNFVNLDVTGTTTLNGATLATGDLEVSAGGLSLDKSDNPAVTVKRGGTTIAMLGDTGSGNAGDLLLWNSSGGLTTNISGRAVDSYINSGGGFAINNTTASGFKLKVGGTAKIENDLTVTGDVIIGTSGKGIDFSATAGTGTSELLDDYEEGTFTPVVADAITGGNTGTAATADGSYTKIGRLVSITITLVNIDTTGMTAGGNFTIRDLPFTSLGGQTGRAEGSVRADLLTFSGSLTSTMEVSDSYIRLYETATGAADSILKVSAITSGSSDIFISICYQAV